MSTPVSRHFTSDNHSHHRMKFYVIEWCTPKFKQSDTSKRRRVEMYWAFKQFNTIVESIYGKIQPNPIKLQQKVSQLTLTGLNILFSILKVYQSLTSRKDFFQDGCQDGRQNL